MQNEFQSINLTNLLISPTIFFSLLSLIPQILMVDPSSETCVILALSLHYFFLTNFFWHVSEGIQNNFPKKKTAKQVHSFFFFFLPKSHRICFFFCSFSGLYLYMLVVQTFSGDNIKFNLYAVIGWGELIWKTFNKNCRELRERLNAMSAKLYGKLFPTMIILD